MNGITHPYSRDVYEVDDDDRTRIKVTRRDGTVGWFAADGRWLAGERFEADLHLCGWLSAPRGVHRMAPPAH
ncbi:hypothetical protein [Actinophytocola sp.]|jgi:hypothetical protein|uniref:hypothetical protein n=1 Tax=Actinophytocola sp. TaxID=1872138 RepID=UPI002ED83FD4